MTETYEKVKDGILRVVKTEQVSMDGKNISN